MTKKTDIDLEKLLEAGAHFGHQYRRWNPKMRDYMYAVKEGIYVFDLIKTKESLTKALEALTKAASEERTILFVGTKKQVKTKVKEVAQACNSFYVDERWLGGTLTNFDQVRRSIRTLEELEKKVKTAKSEGYTKREILELDRDIEKLKKKFGGVLSMEKFPDLMIVIDTHKERGAVTEARNKGIEIVGIVDSNADPTIIDWPVPMNDDATKALEYVLDLFKDAILEGQKPKKIAKKK